MSLCLILRDKENLWIGADTAVSTEANGKKYRIMNDYREKVFRVGDDIVFCRGLLLVSDQIKKYLLQKGNVDVEELRSYVKRLVSELSSELKKPGEHETGIMVCKADGPIIYFTQAQNFEILRHPDISEGVQCLAGGFESDRAMVVAGKAIRQGKSAFEIFGKTYCTLASNIIGGDLILYHRKKDGETDRYIFAIKEQKEKLTYLRTGMAHCSFHGVVRAQDFQDLNGKSMLDSQYRITSDYLNLNGLNVGNGSLVIDSGGNVSLRGNINMQGGTIAWSKIDETGSAAYKAALAASRDAMYASDDAAEAARIAKQIADGKYKNGSFISGREIYSPTILANHFKVIPEEEGQNVGGYNKIFEALQKNLRVFRDADTTGRGFVNRLYQLSREGCFVNENGENTLKISVNPEGELDLGITPDNLHGVAQIMEISPAVLGRCLLVLVGSKIHCMEEIENEDG